MASGLRGAWAILAVALVFWFLALYPLVHLVRLLWAAIRAAPTRASSGQTPAHSLPIRWLGYCSRLLLLALGVVLYGFVTIYALSSFIHDPRSWLR